MRKIVLYCKSYRNDVLRVKRLAESIQKFNNDNIPFYVSVPFSDWSLFQETLTGLAIILLKDEDIIRANPALNPIQIDALPGGISQQIVKSEFWRLGLSESYLCIDSDCVFIRPFGQNDFITSEGHPYTIIHEAKEFMQFAAKNGMQKICDDFHKERQKIMGIFGRIGPHYDYGPAPFLWNRSVWIALDESFLKPNHMSFYDAILLFPSELLWYGEAMLKYQPFPLIPIDPLFKFYLYEHQFIVGKQQGETIKHLAQDYLGVGYQSNWERKSDFQKKPLLSRTARWLKRNIFRRNT